MKRLQSPHEDSFGLNRADPTHAYYNSHKGDYTAHHTPLVLANKGYFKGILDPRMIGYKPAVLLPGSTPMWQGAASTLNQPRYSRPRAWQEGARIK